MTQIRRSNSGTNTAQQQWTQIQRSSSGAVAPCSILGMLDPNIVWTTRGDLLSKHKIATGKHDLQPHTVSVAMTRRSVAH